MSGATAVRERAVRLDAATESDAPAPASADRKPSLLELQRAAGNQALQHALRVVPAHDPLEREADQLATRGTRSAGRCACGGHIGADGQCARCRALGLALKRRSTTANTPVGDARSIVAETLRRPGRPLDPSMRSLMESRTGSELSGVRIHTDAEADRSARALDARAYTVGSDIAFAAGEFAPHSREGAALLAHELTHVVQQTSGRASGVVQRQPREQQQSQSPMGDVVPRPPGLPLEQGFILQPISPELEPLFAGLPEGQIVPLTLSGGGGVDPLAGLGGVDPLGGLGPGAPVGDASEWGALPYIGPGLGGGGTSLLSSINAQLMTQGFRSAGPNAIVLSAVPQLPGPLGYAHWGHTAVGVRMGGQLQTLRGFNPQMLEMLLNPGQMSQVYRGTAGVAGEITSDLGMLRSTRAMTLEIPVSAELAQQALRELPDVGPRAGTLYTARPSVMQLCAGENCVLFAVRQAESAVGEIGPSLPGRGTVSIANIARGTGGAGVEANTASQGALMRYLQQASRPGDVAAALPEGAVASGMPTGLRVLKWGGRVMIVVGAATVPLEVYLAPPEERTRTAVGATAGFLGGLALGATAGLVCGPGAPVCSVVLGIGFGIAGGLAARGGAEEVYDLATGRPVNPLFQTFRDIYSGRAWESFQQYMFLMRYGPYGARGMR